MTDLEDAHTVEDNKNLSKEATYNDEEREVEDGEDGELEASNNNEEGGNEDAQITTSQDGIPPAAEGHDMRKHPLQNRWALWYDNPGRRTSVQSWGDHLKKVTAFDTVEDFWRVFNNIKPASDIASGSNYHLFKDDIEPKWEDAANSKGGKWTVQIPNKNRKELVNQMWLYAILGCIGEAFENSDDVCGIVVSIRKAQDRISLWTRDWKNEAAVRTIGRQLKSMLELPENVMLGYQSHDDSLKAKGTTKDRYMV